jgi:hypothetical protein
LTSEKVVFVSDGNGKIGVFESSSVSRNGMINCTMRTYARDGVLAKPKLIAPIAAKNPRTRGGCESDNHDARLRKRRSESV